MINEGYYCVPECHGCVTAGMCGKMTDVPAAEHVRGYSATDAWADHGPNSLPMVRLSCGCRGIPWPVVSKLGGKDPHVTCDWHGNVKVIKEPYKRIKARAERDLHANDLTLDSEDPPPF